MGFQGNAVFIKSLFVYEDFLDAVWVVSGSWKIVFGQFPVVGRPGFLAGAARFLKGWETVIRIGFGVEETNGSLFRLSPRQAKDCSWAGFLSAPHS